jgi:hypothetical protein
VTERDAFEEEMLFRSLSDEEVERLLAGRAPEGSQLVEVAEFAHAVRQTLPAPPVAGGSGFVTQLAQTARAARLANAEAAQARVPRTPNIRLLSSRVPRLASLAAALALVPMLFAGLAIAGVSLPAPARDAFEAVGVSLPNQPSDEGQPSQQSNGGRSETGGEAEVDDASSRSTQSAETGIGRKPSAETRLHGTEKANPARAGGRANGEQGRGRALGKRDLAPGQLTPPGQLKKGEDLKEVSKAKENLPANSSKPVAPPGTEKSTSLGNSGGGGANKVKPAKSAKGGKR